MFGKTIQLESLHHLPTEWLGSLPGLIVIKTLDTTIAYSNEITTSLVGFNHYEEMQNIYEGNLPCPGVIEMLPTTLQQDNITYRDKRPSQWIEIRRFQDNTLWPLSTYKIPIINCNKEHLGLFCQSIPLSQSVLSAISVNYHEITKNNQRKNQLSCQIGPPCPTLKITNREHEVLFYYLGGKSARMIAEKLKITRRTVEDHLEHLKSKLSVMNKADLIEKAMSLGLNYRIPESIARIIMHPGGDS